VSLFQTGAKNIDKSMYSPAFWSGSDMFLLQKDDKLLYSSSGQEQEQEQEQVEVQTDVSHLLIYVRMTERRMTL